MANITAEIRNSAYESDSGTFLPVVFDNFKQKKSLPNVSLAVETYTPVSGDSWSNPQKNFLYYIGCTVLAKVHENCTTCRKCYAKCFLKKPPNGRFAKLAILKQQRSGKVNFMTVEMFQFFIQLNHIFHQHYESLKRSDNIKVQLYKTMYLVNVKLPKCHNLKTKLINYFIRHSIQCMQQRKIKKRRFDSGSMNKC